MKYKMERKVNSGFKYSFYLIAVFIGLTAFNFSQLGGKCVTLQAGHIESYKAEENNLSPSDFSKRILFIIDFDDFMCFYCLDLFLDFYHSLPISFQEESIWGILVYKEENKKNVEQTNIRVIEKKLQGFIEANRIQSPIVVDYFHVFNSMVQEGSAVIFFDQRRKAFKKHTFPLSSEQKSEIIESLTT